MIRKHGVKIVKFGMVSGLATVIDIFVLWLFTSVFGVYYLLSAVLAFVVGSTTNYSMNYFWTFSGAKHGKAKGLASFMGIGTAGLVITLVIMASLVEFLGVHYLVARIIAAFVTLFWNYVLNSIITFK